MGIFISTLIKGLRSLVSIYSFGQYSRFTTTTNIDQQEVSILRKTSTVTDNTKQTWVASKETTTTVAAAASSSCIRPRHTKLLQDLFLIWLDPQIDEKKKYFQDSITEFRSIVLTIELFTDVDECLTYMRNKKKDKIILIVPETLDENILSDIHNMTQLHAILVFCRNLVRHNEWVKKWLKVQHVSASIEDICQSLKKIVRQRDQDAVPMSFFPKQTTETIAASGYQNLDRLDSSYMYSTLFKEIALEINEDTKQVEKFMEYCRIRNVADAQLSKFYNDYQNETAVRLYTNNTFLYGMLNTALRTFDVETMLRMGFFIRKLHQQLEKLNCEERHIFTDEFTVYRGQQFCERDFKHLCNAKHGLFSFNNFLSTSRNKAVALMFVPNQPNSREDEISVVFTVMIDPAKASTSRIPFASIKSHSAFEDEEEVLFSMHALFRIQDIYESTQNNGTWEVELTLTDDNDPQLADLIPSVRSDIQQLAGWFRMSRFMIRIGHFDQAEVLLQELLKDASSDDERPNIYHELAATKFFQGQYKEAATYCEEELRTKLKTVTENDPSMASAYSNKGGVYRKLGDYPTAIKLYEKALDVAAKAGPLDDSFLAHNYNEIGLVYKDMRDHKEALQFFEKSRIINEKIYPLVHPSMAISYDNIGEVHFGMGDHSTALHFLEESTKIRERVHGQDHHYLAHSYNKTGRVYEAMGDYYKALEYYEKAHPIFRKAFHPMHPDLLRLFDNISVAYEKTGNLAKARQFSEEAVRIREQSLSATCSD